jgi:hypothetical protein
MPSARATLRRYHPTTTPTPAPLAPTPEPLSRARDPLATMSAPARPDLRLVRGPTSLPPTPAPVPAEPVAIRRPRVATPTLSPADGVGGCEDFELLFDDLEWPAPDGAAAELDDFPTDDPEQEPPLRGPSLRTSFASFALVGLGFSLGVVAHGLLVGSFWAVSGP